MYDCLVWQGPQHVCHSCAGSVEANGSLCVTRSSSLTTSYSQVKIPLSYSLTATDSSTNNA